MGQWVLGIGYFNANRTLGSENVSMSASNCVVLTGLAKAIDEIGWTPYHLKLFFLNGFG